MKNIFKRICPIVVLAVLVTIFFYQIIFFNKLYLAGDLYYYYSVRVLVSDALKSLHFPLWTQYLTCGFPLMANPEAGVFDPINLLLLYLFKPVIAFNLLICVYFFMASLFTYLFCRSIDLDLFSSLFSAIVFTFGGAFAGRLVHISMVMSATFMPFIFWSINMFFKKRNLKYIFLTGLGIGLSFLPGHPQIAAYICFASALYFLFNGLFAIRDNFKVRDIIRYIALLVFIFVVAFGVSAIQMLPTKELVKLSGRAQLMTYEGGRNISLYFQHLITYIFPYFFGRDSAGSIGYWGKGSFWELYIYLGILPFCLLFAIFSKLRDKRVLFFLGLLALSLLYALGKNSPIYFILFHFLAPLRYFKDPCRFVFISSFAMAILAGLGLNFIASEDNLLKKMLKRTLIVFFIILCSVIIFNFIFYFNKDSIANGNRKTYLSFKGIGLNDPYVQLPLIFFISLIIVLWGKLRRIIRKEIFYVLMISITIIDLFIISYSHNLPQDSAIVTSSPPSVIFLRKDRGLFRVYHIGPEFAYGKQRGVEIDKIPFFVIWGIQSANFAGPLRIAGHNAVFSDINDINLHKKTYLDGSFDKYCLFNVKYFTSTVKVETKFAKLIFDDGTISVYENPQVIPRIFFVSTNKFSLEYKEKIKDINKFSKSVTDLSLKPTIGEENVSYAIKIRDYQDSLVDLDLRNDPEGFLVVSDTYYPGWKVFVDGKREAIIRANTIMRAVFVKGGMHNIKFVYDPLSFKLGFLVSLFSLAIVFFMLWSKTGNRII